MIYLDNGATSFPKPPEVTSAVEHYMRYCGASAGRSAHKRAREAMEIATSCRLAVAELINAENPEDIIFVKNATEGLNIIIRGILHRGDKVTVSPLEHNSVMRPLYASCAEISVLPLTADGRTDVEYLEGIDEDTALVVINHVSNVSGALNDIYRAGEICQKLGIPLLADCSQSAGHFPIDVQRLQGSVVFPGHKGLLGPQGTGVMYVHHDISPVALCYGGTGSDSENMHQPRTMPDYYESGTLNLMGIAGLLTGVEYVTGHFAEIEEKEKEFSHMLREGLGNMKRVRLIAPDLHSYGAVISFTADHMQPSEIALLLDEKYDIAVRSGLHCAPAAHKAYGTLSSGAVRLTPGCFNTQRDISVALDAINNILK